MATAAPGIVWPSMRLSLGVPLAGLGLLLVVGTVAYWISTWVALKVVRQWAFSKSLGGAAVVAAVGLFLLAASPVLWVALGGAALVGLGSGAVNSVMNAHATVEGGVRRMGLLHASWALGAGAAPVLGMLCSYLVTSVAGAGRPPPVEDWRLVFLTTALVFVLVAAGWHWRRDNGRLTSVVQQLRVGPQPIDRPLLVSWIVFAFVYVGLESSIGQWTYSQLPGATGLASPLAGVVLTLFWLSMMVGRLALGLGGQWFDPLNRKLALLDCGILGSLLATLLLWAVPSGLAAAVALPAMGLSLSILLPLLYKAAPDQLGYGRAARVVFYESTAATLGCALVPAAAGIWLQWWGASSLKALLLLLAVVMTAAHIAGKTRVSGGERAIELAPVPDRPQ
jgi:fucose permease